LMLQVIQAISLRNNFSELFRL